MNQSMTEPQMGFAFLHAAELPVMAPAEDVAAFENESDAINYSIDQYAKLHGYSFTQTNLAGQLGMTKQTLSKLRQGLISIPRNRLQRIVEVTRSYSIVQFHVIRAGLTVRTSAKEEERVLELQRLKDENTQLRERYQRVVGQ